MTAGWQVQEHWSLPAQWDLSPLHLVCLGCVGSDDDACNAMIAAARGAGLIVWPGEGFDLEAFVSDLNRIGRVEHLPECNRPGRDSLDDDQRELLHLLAEGASMPEAASQMYVSLRTAERRLAAARRILGVRSTSEAVVAATRSEEEDETRARGSRSPTHG